MNNHAHINLAGLVVFIILSLIVFGYILWQSGSQLPMRSVTLQLPPDNYQAILHYPDKEITLYRINDRLRLQTKEQEDVIIDLDDNRYWIKQDDEWVLFPPLPLGMDATFDPYQIANMVISDKSRGALTKLTDGLTSFNFYANNQELIAFFSETGLVQRIERKPDKSIYIYYEYPQIGNLPPSLVNTDNVNTQN